MTDCGGAIAQFGFAPEPPPNARAVLAGEVAAYLARCKSPKAMSDLVERFDTPAERLRASLEVLIAEGIVYGAMDMVAERVWASRERHFEEAREIGGTQRTLMQCASIAHLGGATLANEENYLIKKLFTGGLGMVAISNQARI